MDYSSKLTQLLQQLEVETGITFTVADSTLDEAETLAKVRDFLSFYQTRDNRNLFLSRFFLGQLSPEEILRGKQRFHIEESTLRVLFLLECKQPYDPAVISVLSNLNASGADMIVELDSLHIAVIRQLKHALSDQALRKDALGLVDTLEAETMVSFAVAYDSCCEAFSQLPVSYQNCHAALRIGNIFYSSERVFGYRELGLGKLLYSVTTIWKITSAPWITGTWTTRRCTSFIPFLTAASASPRPPENSICIGIPWYTVWTRSRS